MAFAWVAGAAGVIHGPSAVVLGSTLTAAPGGALTSTPTGHPPGLKTCLMRAHREVQLATSGEKAPTAQKSKGTADEALGSLLFCC